jgi:DNA-binding PadR family transcriptional regulator
MIPLSIVDDSHDDDFAKAGIRGSVLDDPLSKHEIQVLGCALYEAKRQRLINYSAVLRLTYEYNDQQPMGVPMIYKTFHRLATRGLLSVRDADTRNEGASRSYEIRPEGKQALRMAILNSRVLADVVPPINAQAAAVAAQ